MDYDDEIVRWTGIPAIASIPRMKDPDRESIAVQAKRLGPEIRKKLG
jgi:hypothetical protein